MERKRVPIAWSRTSKSWTLAARLKCSQQHGSTKGNVVRLSAIPGKAEG